MVEPVLLGLDLGGTKISAVVGTPDGRIIRKAVVPTRGEEGPERVVSRIIDLLRLVRESAQVSAASVAVLGISHGGPVDPRTGLCSSPNIPGWRDIDLGSSLGKALGYPVALDNDANAGAVAEFLYGAGRGLKHICYMTMGTGIGGGIVSEGRVFRGAFGMAGEIGHVTIVRDGRLCSCGQRGCLQAYASGPAIEAMAAERAAADHDTELLPLVDSVGRIPCEKLCELARQGNANARAVLQDAATAMGIGVANLIKVVDPELVAIGTLAVRAGDLLLDRINEVAYAEYGGLMPERRPIVASELGDDVGDLAALALAAARLEGSA